MLPYDGMIRTGSEGVSHCLISRPLASCARYWKDAGKASKLGNRVVLLVCYSRAGFSICIIAICVLESTLVLLA